MGLSTGLHNTVAYNPIKSIQLSGITVFNSVINSLGLRNGEFSDLTDFH